MENNRKYYEDATREQLIDTILKFEKYTDRLKELLNKEANKNNKT